MLSMTSMEYHLWVWKVCGVWHRPDQPHWYLVYAIALNFIFFFYFPFTTAIQILWATNMNEFMDILLILPTLMVGLKSMLIVRNQAKLLRLFDLLNRMDGMLENDAQKQVIQESIDGSRIIVAALSCEYYFSIVLFFVVPMTMKEPVLMWSSWLPFDYRHVASRYYSLMVYQLVGSLLIGFTSSSMDVYGLALYRLLRAHLQVLGNKTSQLGKSPMENDSESEKMRKTIASERQLFRCIDYHNLCISFSNLLNDVVSVHYSIQFCMSGIIICGSEFKLFSVDPWGDKSHFILAILYFIGMTVEIFLPCYFGSQVKSESEQLVSRMFDSNWMNQSRRFKTAMYIFNERAHRSVAPFAGGLFALALPTFVTTMRFAYSLLALLKEMGGKE